MEMTPPSSAVLSAEPDQNWHAPSPDLKEKMYYGGFGVLIALAIYVPMQLKIDARLMLDRIAIPGLAMINILLLVAFYKLLQNPKNGDVEDKASTRLSKAILGMGLFSLAALIFGTLRTGGAAFGEDFIVWKRWVTMLFVYLFVRRFLHTEKQLRRLLWVMSFVVAFAAVNLLRENLSTGMSSQTFRGGLRFGGIFDWGGENDLGAFLAEFIVIPMALFFTEKGFIKKMMFLGMSFVTALGCIFTYSRGAWVGLVIGVTAYLCRRSKAGLIWVVVLGVAALPLLPASVVDRWNMTRDESGRVEDSAQMRLDVWNEGLRLIQSYPLTGVGYNRFRYEVRLKNFRNINLEPHNLYIKIAAEQGIPALLWFFFLLYAAIRCTADARPGLHRELSCAFTGMWFALFMVNMFGNRILREGLIAYFMIFCGIMVWLRTRPESQDAADDMANQAPEAAVAIPEATH